MIRSGLSQVKLYEKVVVICNTTTKILVLPTGMQHTIDFNYKLWVPGLLLFDHTIPGERKGAPLIQIQMLIISNY